MVMLDTRLPDSLHEQGLYPEKLLDQVHLAKENERKKLAAEIHDGVIQEMVGAFYRIKLCRHFASQSRLNDLEGELAEIGRTLQSSVTELRRIMADLHPLPLEELGLVGALREQMEVLNNESIRYHIEVDEALPKLAPAEERAIYRIVQEALTNIRKHSRATAVSLHVQSRDNTISVEVSDNGRGFSPSEIEATNSKIRLEHMGLVGMKERAELLGGYLSINSNPGQGTSIVITLPVSS